MIRYLLGVLAIMFITQLSAQVELVKDINTSGSSFEFNEKIVDFNNKLLFPANDGVNGNEIWVSDGTTAGTLLLKDIYPGINNSSPLYLTATESRVYFRALTENEGDELWYTDGTTSGTLIKTDLISGAVGSTPANFYAANDNLYFIADDPSGEGRELFVTNTSGSANLLTSFSNSNINSLTASPLNDNLIYVTQSVPITDPFGIELYHATSNTTDLLKDIDPGSQSTYFSGLKTILGEVYFFADTTGTFSNLDLWKTDGTEAGTISIKELPENSVGSFLTPIDNGLIFFVASGPGIGPELWGTDGTESGTQLVEAINPTNTTTGSEINSITPAGNKIFFAARDGSSGQELWVSDGTQMGTNLVKDINLGASFGLDGTISPMIWYDGNLYFAADDGSNGNELWVSDGTEAGTMILEDINPGSASSNPKNFVVFNGSIYFVATDAANGRELRKYTPDASTPLITGIISDVDSGDPLESVNVENINLTTSLLSDGNGAYAIEANAGDTLVFTLNNYRPDSVIVLEGQTTYNVNLQYDPCYAASCPFGEICVDGVCGEPCDFITCPEGQTCGTGWDCVPIDPCDGVGCPFGEVCVDGICGEPCDFVTCPEGQTCDSQGNCVFVDPCDEINCPFGKVCFQGSCYDATQGGIVKDQFSNPLDSVLIYHIESQDTLYSDSGGNYYFDKTGNFRFQKQGYLPITINISQGLVNVVLANFACENITCSEGLLCYGGSCYDSFVLYDASFVVKDKDNGQPLPNIEVAPLDDYQSTFTTNSNGEVTLSLNSAADIIFRDPSGTYSEFILTPSSQNQEVFLTNKCDEINCPFGQVCYQGSCYDAVAGTSAFSGYVFTADSIPLTNVYVSNGNNQTVTSSSGYFELTVNDFPDSIKITVSKTGYGSVEKQMFQSELNEVYIFELDKCFNISCPFGQVCYEGSCYLPESTTDPATSACDGVLCPFGEVCFDGSCYDPCVVGGPELCANELPEACDNVTCPFGQVCHDGSCYDPCISTDASLCYQASVDPCANINPPPGYICIEGVVVPDCPSHTLACATATICNVVACPPGDTCFQCGGTNTGTSLISGQLNLESLIGGRSNAEQNVNVFLFLVNTATGEKVSIAKTDANGGFIMENIQAGEYRLSGSFKGYFINDEERVIQVNEGENIELNISSTNRVVKFSISRITSLNFKNQKPRLNWFPNPNTGTIFYMNSPTVKNLEIFDLSGSRVNIGLNIIKEGNMSMLSLDKKLSKGLYVFKWIAENKEDLQTQTIIILN